MELFRRDLQMEMEKLLCSLPVVRMVKALVEIPTWLLLAMGGTLCLRIEV